MNRGLQGQVWIVSPMSWLASTVTKVYKKAYLR